MRQKELRIALVCYGGVSLAVYMHGVTKEIWNAVRASQAVRSPGEALDGTAAVYAQLLERLRADRGLDLRVLCDIVAGASAGGINSVFLAQAIHSGQSLDPLTELWLERADVDVLLHPDARPVSRVAKFWARPIVSWVLRQPGNVVSESVAPETHEEVREKLSRLIRSRWFNPPFAGLGFSNLIREALEAMARAPAGAPLLPAGHPLDLFVTATDFKGHLETLRLNSPPLVLESEHRLSIGFRSNTPSEAGRSLASPLELVFAARATASFPGAFPPLQIKEIDRLAATTGSNWPSRDAFLKRLMPEHSRRGELDGVSLIDGSVLVNAPFADAISVLRDKPAHREVDRRFVYIDPRPDRGSDHKRDDPSPPGFFSVIFGSLSSIPREQPIRDNLEQLEQQSREMTTLRAIVNAMRPEIEEVVDKLFGRTLFLDRPTPRRLKNWRAKAQAAASERAGYAYHGYAQVKLAGIVTALAQLILDAAPDLALTSPDPIVRSLTAHLASKGLTQLALPAGGASEEAIAFFRAHDLAYRRRRLGLLARRLTRDWEDDATITEADRDAARDTIYEAQALYDRCDRIEPLGEDFPVLAKNVFSAPETVLARFAERSALAQTDLEVDALIAAALDRMPQQLRRKMLLAYLGFPFYDTVTLPLLRGEGMNEFDAVKVDRISPEDAPSIREGGAKDTLRGVEFYNFGAFFSRAYRENDYLWGRLHGAERMVDLIASTLPADAPLQEGEMRDVKREAFLAILREEEHRLQTDPALIPRLRAEVERRMA